MADLGAHTEADKSDDAVYATDVATVVGEDVSDADEEMVNKIWWSLT